MTRYRRAGTDGINFDGTKGVCLDDRGRIWACSSGSYGGVACYDAGSWTSWQAGDFNPQPRCIVYDLEDRIWLGCEKGLAVFQEDALLNWLPEYAYTSAIACDQDGFLWIGFDVSRLGVLKFDGTNELAWYTMDDGLPSNWINCISCDLANNIWVGTGDGLAYFDRDTWTMWDIDSGLPVNEIRDISTAPNGDVWFATPAGLLCKESGVKPPAPSISIYTDKPLYNAGDAMTVSLSYENPGADILIDIYTACQLPDGTLYYYPGGDTPLPFSSGLLPSGTQVPMVIALRYPFDEGFPTGDYLWMTAMCAMGSFDMITDIATAPWTFE